MSVKSITLEPEAVAEEPVPVNSKKREFAAAAAATTVTVVLGLAATGVINRLGEIVRSKIAPPQPEKNDE